MKIRYRSLAAPIIAISATLLLAACGGNMTGAASTAPSASPSASPTPSVSPSPLVSSVSTNESAVASVAAPGVADVDCGPITAANGQKLRVVAKGSAAGVAGCTEAVDVLTEYFQRGDQSQGTAHELAVQGWQCSTIDNGVSNEVLTGCEKDGLTIAAVNS
jgi:hypothetical protein